MQDGFDPLKPIISNEQPKQSNVFENVSYDDFDNSPFEGNGINVNF